MSLPSLRTQVRELYKQLLFIGREYPAGYDYFRGRLKSAFLKRKDLTDPEQIEKGIQQGQFVYKELEALWFLKKYRNMKERYYDK